MRRLKRSAERAAAASQGLASTVRFNASKRIPFWNIIARENSTGSLEEDFLAASLHQGVSGSGRNWRGHRYPHDGSDSESESVDLHSWARSGGPLMRTTSADKFIHFLQNLETDSRISRGISGHAARDQIHPCSRIVTPDRMFDTEYDNQNNRVLAGGYSIMVGEGDLLQPERIHNGIVFNVVRKELLTPSNRSLDSEHNSSNHDSVAECVQLDCMEKEMDASSASESGGDYVREDIYVDEPDPSRVLKDEVLDS